MTLMQTIYDMLRFQLTGLSFLFVLLPLLLLVYYLFPQRLRPAVLLVECLLIYQYGRLGDLRVMLLSIVADYALLRLMEYFDSDARKRRWCLRISVGKNLVLIVVMGAVLRAQNLPQQIGLSVYTLSALCVLFAAYRREIPCERSPVRFALYCTFLPKLYAGPMHAYSKFAEQIMATHLEPIRLLRGFGQFVQGAFKTAIFGGGLYTLSQAASALPGTALAAWLEVVSFAFALYYMLSGFGDMTQGMGCLIGVELPRNFYYPYQSRSVGDFFERFHSTVSGLLRELADYGMARVKNRRLADIAATLLAGALLGLWFGLRVNYLLWGIYLAVFILLERYLYPKALEIVPVLFCRIGTLCVVMAGLTIFLSEGARESATLVKTMFSFGDLLDEAVLYLLASNWLLLLLSGLFATNLCNLIVVRFRRAAPLVATAVLGAVDFVILIIYLALSL